MRCEQRKFRDAAGCIANGLQNFVSSIYEYALALTPRSPKIFYEVTKLEKSFFHAIPRLRFAINPRMLPVLRSLFKLERLKHRRFELLHRFASRLMRLVRHGKGNSAIHGIGTLATHEIENRLMPPGRRSFRHFAYHGNR